MTTPYTQRRLGEHRGPQRSEDTNALIEENYRDFTYLYNKQAQLEVDAAASFSATFKQMRSLEQQIERLELLATGLEEGEGNLVFYSGDQIVTPITGYEIEEVDRLTYHNNYNVLTLPRVSDSSVSKIRFASTDGSYTIANGLETLVVPITPGAENGALIESSQPTDAIVGKIGRVWERNVIANITHMDGAQCYLYVRIPDDLSVTTQTNGLLISPYPIFDVDILEVAYTTNTTAQLSSASTWTPLNEGAWYTGNNDAIGHVAPGGWDGDAIENSGSKAFYFEPKTITAIRLKLKQGSSYTEDTKEIYSYGLSKLDLRYDKFLPTGKVIVKLEAPEGAVINDIVSVEPQIWNIAQADLPEAFSYRVIWESSPGEGEPYTLQAVPSSQRVWLEVTLNELSSGYTPVVSSIVVNYT